VFPLSQEISRQVKRTQVTNWDQQFSNCVQSPGSLWSFPGILFRVCPQMHEIICSLCV
jgi:hypothetical protein